MKRREVFIRYSEFQQNTVKSQTPYVIISDLLYSYELSPGHHHRLLTNKMPDGILRFNLQYSVLNTILYLGHKSFNNNKIIYSPWKHCDGKIFYLCKAGSAWGDQGTESLWLDSQLSVVDVPSRDRSPEGNRGE